MRLAALFLWLALPIAGYATYQIAGIPHAIWSYRFVDNGDRYNPYVYRHYLDCTYIGWRWHSVTVPAKAGRCPWVRFFHQGANQ